MKRWNALKTTLFAITVLMALCGIENADTQAASKTTAAKATYTIKRHNENYSEPSGNVTAKYTYQLPQLKGNSRIVKKINASLKKDYKASLKDKRSLFSMAKQQNQSYYPYKMQYFTTTACKVTYNRRGYVSFRFHHDWFAGGVHNGWTEGKSYSLKTGKLLNVSDVISGNKTAVKNKIIRKYFSKFPAKSANQYAKDELNKTKIGKFQFYLNKGNVVVCFGPYQPGGGNGESKIVLKGNYQ